MAPTSGPSWTTDDDGNVLKRTNSQTDQPLKFKNLMSAARQRWLNHLTNRSVKVARWMRYTQTWSDRLLLLLCMVGFRTIKVVLTSAQDSQGQRSSLTHQWSPKTPLQHWGLNELTAPHIPQQNVMAERFKCTLLEICDAKIASGCGAAILKSSQGTDHPHLH